MIKRKLWIFFWILRLKRMLCRINCLSWGIVKTTLAQCVYNDEMIKKNFDKALWVCVSDVFEVKMIAEKIVESGGGKKDNYLQLDTVQNELRKMLDGKKYLLVLDDVWNEDPLK
ncbi:hypothetical protein P3S68_023424 [Capsicum galapagoense]